MLFVCLFVVVVVIYIKARVVQRHHMQEFDIPTMLTPQVSQ